MKTLLACACAAAVVVLVDPDRVLFSLAVAWVGLAVAVAPFVGGVLLRRRRETRAAGAAQAAEARRRSPWVPGTRGVSSTSFPYGQSSR